MRAKLLWLASCVWHEKRHFFDTCLTNYGAYRFRKTFAFAANFGPLLAYAKSRDRKVWFPVELYGCPIRRRLLGIESPPENINTIAKYLRDSKRALYNLDAPAKIGEHSLALGGEAQLEGVAYISQMHAIEHRFGASDVVMVQRLFGERLSRSGSYRMIETVAGALGCSKQAGTNAVLVNPGIAASIFITALCGRSFDCQSKTLGKHFLPGRRFSELFEALGPKSSHFEMSDEEAWVIVNKAAKQLWGRDALEEIEADIDGMESAFSTESAPWLDVEGLFDAWRDFIALRRSLLAAVKAEGPASMGPRAFPEVWLGRLHPWRIIATPGGETAASSSTVVFGRAFNQPSGLEAMVPKFVIWGRLIVPTKIEGAFTVADREAWLQMLERHAPRALLMENGRRHRLMIPPQIERQIEELRMEGYEPCFEPLFEYPELRATDSLAKDAQEYAEWSGRETLICDVTGEELDIHDAALLTPWEYRRSGLRPPIKQESGDILEIIEMFRDAADWSDWVVKRSLLC